jgi:opacity protein-like surface antigen
MTLQFVLSTWRFRSSLWSAVITLALTAAAMAVLAVAPARADALDIRHDSDSSTPIVAETYLRDGSGAAFYDSNRHPLRRRSPRYDGYGPRQRTFGTLGLGSFDPSNQPGSGLFASGTVGTELQSPLDLGVSLQWYHRSTGGSQFITTFTDPAGNTGTRVVETDKITTDLVPLMAFLRVKFPVSPGVEPYVGAGAGWEWLHVEGVDSNGFSFADDYDGFGAQFFGGANFTVGPNTALYGEVLYNASTVNADFYDPNLGVNVRDEIDMDGAAAHAGLRFRF